MPDSPCTPWITGADISCGEAGERASAALAASELLFVLSGRQYPGECETTNTYGECDCSCGGWPATHPALWDHRAVGMWDWGGICPWRMQLGHDPIVDVSEVVIDGEVLDPGSYSVLEDLWLVRADRLAWPCSGSWTVTFSWGDDPPEQGLRAAKALACELIQLAAVGDCDLPQNVSNMTRQGLSAAFEQLGVEAEAVTGLREVELFLDTYNPNKLQDQPVAIIPGVITI